MKTLDRIERLSAFVRRLKKDGVPSRMLFRDWKKIPGNAEFVDDLFDYKREGDMPHVVNLIRPFFHDTLPLVLLNYNQVAHNTLHHYGEKGWTPVMRQCRGTVLDTDGKLVALAYEKMFNHGELKGARIPDEPFDATKKMDGHLCIVFWYGGKLHVTTRGSFKSPTSKVAAKFFQRYFKRWEKQYGKTLEKVFPEGMTALFEFIHPQTHVIVDYKGEKKIYIHGAFVHSTGLDQHYEELEAFAKRLKVDIVERWQGEKFSDLEKLEADLTYRNEEGHMVRFRNSRLYVKVKSMGYVSRMIGDKLNYTKVMQHIINGTLEKKVADLDGEVQMRAADMKKELMGVLKVKDGKKAAWEFLYGFLTEEQKDKAGPKALCRQFYKWLVDTGQMKEPAPAPKKAPAKRKPAAKAANKKAPAKRKKSA